MNGLSSSPLLPPSTPLPGILLYFLSQFSLQAPPVGHALGETTTLANALLISFREIAYSKLSTTLSALGGDYFRTLLQDLTLCRAALHGCHILPFTSAHASSDKDLKSTSCRRCSSTISSSNATLAPCTETHSGVATIFTTKHLVITRLTRAVPLLHSVSKSVIAIVSIICDAS